MNEPQKCSDCRLKVGDQTMMNAVFLATGPGLETSDSVVTGQWVFLSADDQVTDFSANTLTGIIGTGLIEFDSALFHAATLPGKESPYCANYAVICPGTYSYDQNGIRIETSGGGDYQYREYCCGDYPWTPVYKNPDEIGDEES